MKKSELKKYVRENIISELSENTDEEIAKTKELTTAIKDLESVKKEAGIEEVENVGLADLEEMGYNAADDFFETNVKQLLNSPIDFRYYLKGLMQGLSDAANSYGLNENQEPQHKDYYDDHIDIGMFYLEGFGKEHTLTNDQLEKLGKKIVNQLYKGDVGKAYSAIVKRDLRENDDEVFNPDAKVKKTKGLAKAKEELALLTREMKSLAKKYSKAEGEEKEKLVKTLKAKTKLKKELESILDNKKI
jgi:hypothetical protein